MLLASGQALAISLGGLVIMLSLLGMGMWVWRRYGEQDPADSNPKPREDRTEIVVLPDRSAVDVGPEPNPDPTEFIAGPEPSPDATEFIAPPEPNSDTTEFIAAPEPTVDATEFIAAPEPTPDATEFIAAPEPTPNATEFIPRPEPSPQATAPPSPPEAEDATEFIPAHEILGKNKELSRAPPTPAPTPGAPTAKPAPQKLADPPQTHLAIVEVREYFEHAVEFLRTFEHTVERGHVDLEVMAGEITTAWDRNIDFVKLGGPPAIEDLLGLALGEHEAIIRTAATLVLFDHGSKKSVRTRIATAIDKLDERGRAPLLRAIELWGDLRGDALANKGFESTDDDERAAEWLKVLATRGSLPNAAMIERALGSETPSLLAAGLRALDRESGSKRGSFIDKQVFAKHPGVKLAAARAGLMIGSRSAWVTCRQLAKDPTMPEACELLATLATPKELRVLLGWANKTTAHPHTVWCLGLTGRVVGIEACIGNLANKDADRASAAFDGFVAATGYAGERVVDDARAWWKTERERFDSERRYLGGKPYDLASILSVLRSGPAPQRRALEAELAIRSGRAILLPTRVLPQRQFEVLTRLESAGLEIDFESGFPWT